MRVGVVWTFLLSSILSPLSPSLWETARYRLKYCLKGPLNPKPTNQPTKFKEDKNVKEVAIFPAAMSVYFVYSAANLRLLWRWKAILTFWFGGFNRAAVAGSVFEGVLFCDVLYPTRCLDWSESVPVTFPTYYFNVREGSDNPACTFALQSTYHCRLNKCYLHGSRVSCSLSTRLPVNGSRVNKHQS